MRPLQTNRREEVNRHSGLRVAGHYPLHFFYRLMSRTEFTTQQLMIYTQTATITEAIKPATLEMLQNMRRELEYRVDVFRATKEAHVQTY